MSTRSSKRYKYTSHPATDTIKPINNAVSESQPSAFIYSTGHSINHQPRHKYNNKSYHHHTTGGSSSNHIHSNMDDNKKINNDSASSPIDALNDMLDCDTQLKYYRTPCHNTIPCWLWCNANLGIRHYHDHHYGYPVRNKYKLFAYMAYQILMCGLKWDVVNNKLSDINDAFMYFDYDRLAQHNGNTEYIDQLMQNSKIIRDKRKLNNIIHNATVCVKLDSTYTGGFVQYIWDYSIGLPWYERLLYTGIPPQSHMRTHQQIGGNVQYADGGMY